MSAPLINLNESSTLEVKAGNSGNGSIVANSLRITISVGTNTTILGLGAGSDPRWSIFFHGPGISNTIILINKGAASFGPSDLGVIHIRVKGVVLEGPQTITGNISYLANVNTLLGGAQSASQGNTAITDDNSTTSLTVTSSVPAVTGVLDFSIAANNCNAVLNWKTTAKNTVDSFEVEHGTNEIQFTKVGTVVAKNNIQGSTYGYVIEQRGGRGYYRLKIIDSNGKFRYSKIVNVDTKCAVKKGF